MSKVKQAEFVVHDWLQKLTFQQQAVLLTALRGADGTSIENPAKCITRYIRGVVLKAAGKCELEKNDNTFMWGDYETFEWHYRNLLNDHDAYPQHFILHMTHAAEVIGYKHPDEKIARQWRNFYLHMVDSFHMNPETEEQMDTRLNDWDNEIQPTSDEVITGSQVTVLVNIAEGKTVDNTSKTIFDDLKALIDLGLADYSTEKYLLTEKGLKYVEQFKSTLISL